ncbi:RING/FYVE/PHD-type zinc finger family protein, partial [Thalictrum thalictroides]
NLLGLPFQATWKISWTKYKDSCIDLKSNNYSQIDRLVSAPATLNSISHGIWSFQGCGIFSILTGQNKGQIDVNGTQDCCTNVSFLVSGKNGDSLLHPSVYIPSAPPLLEPHGYHPYKEVLEAEPPEWLPDSSTSACMQCTSPFTALTRGRHHCRFCGGIFCRACSKGRCLMPVKFRERNPQRVCDACYDRLDPLQGVLINCISNAAQAAKHDVSDWTCTRGWLNLPVGLSMEYEIYKSTNTLRNYFQ